MLFKLCDPPSPAYPPPLSCVNKIIAPPPCAVATKLHNPPPYQCLIFNKIYKEYCKITTTFNIETYENYTNSSHAVVVEGSKPNIKTTKHGNLKTLLTVALTSVAQCMRP